LSVLVINPRSDEQFAAFAREQASEAESPEDLQAALRRRYPRSVVRPRELDGEKTEVWYVYRDGRWASPVRGGWRQRGEREER
jgi:hypothetical protein